MEHLGNRFLGCIFRLARARRRRIRRRIGSSCAARTRLAWLTLGRSGRLLGFVALAFAGDIAVGALVASARFIAGQALRTAFCAGRVRNCISGVPGLLAGASLLTFGCARLGRTRIVRLLAGGRTGTGIALAVVTLVLLL